MTTFIPDPKKPSNPYLNRIRLVIGDVTKQEADAIVSFLPQDLEYRGAVNASILAAAGQKMDEFMLEQIYKPRPGDVYAVPGFDLPCRHILFAIMPVWRTDIDREDKHLLIAARKTMEMARVMTLSSIAFPPLAMGRHGYPKPRGARLLLQGIAERMVKTIREVRIVCPDENTYNIFEERLASYK